jgi:hypothetical protein
MALMKLVQRGLNFGNTSSITRHGDGPVPCVLLDVGRPTPGLNGESKGDNEHFPGISEEIGYGGRRGCHDGWEETSADAHEASPGCEYAGIVFYTAVYNVWLGCSAKVFSSNRSYRM